MFDLWWGTSGPRSSPDIAVVAESWGSDEDALKHALVGSSGQEFYRILLDGGINLPPQAKPTTPSQQMRLWDSSKIFLTNLIPKRPPQNDILHFFYPTQEARKSHIEPHNGLYPRAELLAGLANLHQQMGAIQPKVIVAVGNYALWALAPNCVKISDARGYKTPTGIMNWRGSQLYYGEARTPLVPLIPPAAILRQWSLRFPTVHDIKARIAPVVRGERWIEPPYGFHIRPSLDDIHNFLKPLFDKLEQGPTKVSVDAETRGGHMACIGLAYEKYRALCIPFMQVAGNTNYWMESEEAIIQDLLRKLFTHPNILLIGQNFLYDAQYISMEQQVKVSCYLDTQVYHHTLWPGTPARLDYLSSLYCKFHTFWKEESKDWDPKLGEEQLWYYNCKDACITLEVAEQLESLAVSMGMQDQCHEQMALWHLAFDMILRGMKIDKDRRLRVTEELLVQINLREEYFEEMVPWAREAVGAKKNAKPWYRSPKQLGTLFYDVLGQREIKDRKRGTRTVDDNALSTIMQREPLLKPLCQALQEYRSLGVFYNTFAKAKLDADDRMRCSIKFVPETFRWSTAENAFGRGTNLQNLPKGTEDRNE